YRPTNAATRRHPVNRLADGPRFCSGRIRQAASDPRPRAVRRSWACLYPLSRRGDPANTSLGLRETETALWITRMADRSPPRVALLGFSIECNKFAPPATKAHFLARTYLEGDAIVAEARSPTPTMLPETPGFIAAMDVAGPWTPIGIALAMSEHNGPVEHGFFEELVGAI